MSEAARTRPVRSRMPVADAIRVARETAKALIESFPDLGDDPDTFIGTLDGECDALDVAERLIERALEREAMATDTAYLVAARRESMADLSARKGRFERQADRLREAALAIMLACKVEGAPKPKLVRPGFTASIREPVEQQRALRCIDRTKTPQRFRKQVWVEDEPAIRVALHAGEDVDGWELANSTGPTLAVRVK